MSFHSHWEIFPSDKGATLLSYALAHRLDEFPAGYPSAGCSPAWPASASPAGYEYALQSSCRSRIFHRTANSVLTVCLSPGGHRISFSSPQTYSTSGLDAMTDAPTRWNSAGFLVRFLRALARAFTRSAVETARTLGRGRYPSVRLPCRRVRSARVFAPKV